MKCPFCEYNDTKVIDSRRNEDGTVVRRRRECEDCEKRFTTYERAEDIMLVVIKKDGSRQSFDRKKLLTGILKACEKRPVELPDMERAVDDIERGLNNLEKKEIESTFIGELIMEKLKDLDEVAYIRFASVYREFTDIDTFILEIEKMRSSN